jgi:predicted site-specific integrase-resolvase
MGTELYRIPDAAAFFGVSIPTIRKWVREGFIVPRRIQGSRLLWFTRDDLMNAASRPRRGAPALRVIKN